MMTSSPDREKLSDVDSSDDDDSNDSEDAIRRLLNLKLNAGQTADKKEKTKVLADLSVQGIVDYIQSGKASKIVTLAGAGISTSAGIPDFRSPDTGLYSNLQKYKLADPHAIFEIGYFRTNPQPFFKLAKQLYPSKEKFKPTPSHHFIRLIQDKKILLRHYTQNIDTLERLAGICDDKLVEAHGTFHTAHCIDPSCKAEYSQQWMEEKIFVYDVVPTCGKCNSVVKPDIVFFGENLPQKFFDRVEADLKACDLLIVMGTSLTVQPFACLVDRVSESCPRLLLNREPCGTTGSDYISELLGIRFDFDSDEAYRDVAMIGDTDDSCIRLAQLLGWKEDLERLMGPGA